ncbi:MAG: 50S ribosomal protein L31 [Patescibacteria group bacterium]
MKSIHPNYVQAKVTCSCGNVMTFGSTVSSMTVELCSSCHPFYTGEQKIVDTANRVKKFTARTASAQKIKANKKMQEKVVEKVQKRTTPLTLREMMQALDQTK